MLLTVDSEKGMPRKCDFVAQRRFLLRCRYTITQIFLGRQKLRLFTGEILVIVLLANI